MTDFTFGINYKTCKIIPHLAESQQINSGQQLSRFIVESLAIDCSKMSKLPCHAMPCRCHCAYQLESVEEGITMLRCIALWFLSSFNCREVQYCSPTLIKLLLSISVSCICTTVLVMCFCHLLMHTVVQCMVDTGFNAYYCELRSWL